MKSRRSHWANVFQKCIHVMIGALLKRFRWLFIMLLLGFAVPLIIIWTWSDQNHQLRISISAVHAVTNWIKVVYSGQTQIALCDDSGAGWSRILKASELDALKFFGLHNRHICCSLNPQQQRFPELKYDTGSGSDPNRVSCLPSKAASQPKSNLVSDGFGTNANSGG